MIGRGRFAVGTIGILCDRWDISFSNKNNNKNLLRLVDLGAVIDTPFPPNPTPRNFVQYDFLKLQL